MPSADNDFKESIMARKTYAKTCNENITKLQEKYGKLSLDGWDDLEFKEHCGDADLDDVRDGFCWAVEEDMGQKFIERLFIPLAHLLCMIDPEDLLLDLQNGNMNHVPKYQRFFDFDEDVIEAIKEVYGTFDAAEKECVDFLYTIWRQYPTLPNSVLKASKERQGSLAYLASAVEKGDVMIVSGLADFVKEVFPQYAEVPHEDMRYMDLVKIIEMRNYIVMSAEYEGFLIYTNE
jgi:hypothetical protein